MLMQHLFPRFDRIDRDTILDTTFSYVVFFFFFFYLILGGETLWTIWSGNGEREKNRGSNTESNFPQIFAIRVPAFSRVTLILPCPPLGLLPFHGSIPRMENCQQVWLGLNFSGQRWRLYRFFHSRRVFLFGLERIINEPRFSGFSTYRWIGLVVKYSVWKLFFIFFSSSSYFFSNEIIFVFEVILICVIYLYLSLASFSFYKI